MTREQFEREFSSTTLAYQPDFIADHRPVVVVVGPASEAHDALLLSLTNQLARAHRRLVFVGDLGRALRCASPWKYETVRDATLGLSRAINPFIDAGGGNQIPEDALISLGLGTDAEITLGASGWDALVGVGSQITADRTSIFGAGLASCIGAACAFRRALGVDSIAPGRFSLWDGGRRDGEAGPTLSGPINVGRVLQVGAGAVGCALDYWLALIRFAGKWAIVDGDIVEVKNLNRQMLFLAADAGWPDGEPSLKVGVVERLFGGEVTGIPYWYDAYEAREPRDARYDLVLPLANERGVRRALHLRGQPVLLHATTSPWWTAFSHRHVPELDECIVCRLPDTSEPVFACATGPVGASEKQSDASLPFLSAAAGLMLLADLVRLQHGRLFDSPVNLRSVNFRGIDLSTSGYAMKCEEACRDTVPVDARRSIFAGTRFAHLDAPTSKLCIPARPARGR